MSLAEQLAAYFADRPDQWIDGMALARVAGSYAWRSRCSDVRRKFGMTIENRQRRIARADGSVYVVSEYRWAKTEAA